MTAQHEQPTRPEGVKPPAWVREPPAPKGDVKHAPPPHEDQTHEEPGYGHGV